MDNEIKRSIQKDKMEVMKDMAHPSGNEWLGDPEMPATKPILFEGEDATVIIVLIMFWLIVGG